MNTDEPVAKQYSQNLKRRKLNYIFIKLFTELVDFNVLSKNIKGTVQTYLQNTNTSHDDAS